MLDAKKMHDTANWQTDLDTLMARVSDHDTAARSKSAVSPTCCALRPKKMITNNTAALGGNASLLALSDE
ncbi:MAG: hypothetical protein ACQEQ6_06535 [Pseudomonadota bacterium]